MAGLDGAPAEGVRFTGMLPRAEYRALLRRARVFVCAPRREDYGIAQLEALADGCVLVTTPSPGPYAALPVARALDERLVGGTSAARDPHRARRPRARLRRARAGGARAVAARGGRPRDRRAAAAAATVARMTPAFRPVRPHHRRRPRHRRGGRAPARRPRRARLARRARRGRLRRVAADCPGSVVFEADVTDQEALDAAVAGTVEAFGGIDTVFANAGIGAPGFVRTMDPESFERVVEVNLIGVWRTIRACLPHIIERRGYVLPVASMAAILPPVGLGAYGAAKSGVEALAPRAAGRDAGLRRGRRGRVLLVDRHRDGARRRPHRDRRGHARDAQGAARQDLPGQRRGRGRRARDRAPQPHRRLPAPAADRC